MARALLEQTVSTSSLQFPTQAIERIGAAILRQSDGSISKLEAAIELAQHDWRDLLMVAGFGYDLAAHEVWLASIQA